MQSSTYNTSPTGTGIEPHGFFIFYLYSTIGGKGGLEVMFCMFMAMRVGGGLVTDFSRRFYGVGLGGRWSFFMFVVFCSDLRRLWLLFSLEESDYGERRG